MALSNLDDLEASWAAFLEDKNEKGKPTQAGVWRRDNPGEWEALSAYRQGKGPRPDLKSQMGRMMVESTDAWHEAKGEAAPPPTKPTFSTSVTEGMTMTLPYTWTFTPGDVAAKGQFWANNNMLHEATGPGPYSYVVAKGALPSGANKVGHSWDTPDGRHVAADPIYSVMVAGGEPPPTGGGTIIWDADYSDGTANEWFAATWGGGGGYSGATSQQFYSMENRNGTWAAKHTLLNGGNRSEFAIYGPDIVQDVNRFYGTEIELPTNFDWSSVGPYGCIITQHDQSNGQAGSPFQLTLGDPRRVPRGIHVAMMTGTWKALPVFTNGGLEYVAGDTSWAGHIIANLVVIPTGQVPLGKRIQVVIRSFRSGATLKGELQAWWKLHGEPQTAWRKSSPETLSKTNAGQGFPTLQHYPGQPYGGHEVYPTTLPQKWGAYTGTGSHTATFTMWHYRALMGTSFEAVASRLT